jgi:hypothetical protein
MIKYIGTQPSKKFRSQVRTSANSPLMEGHQARRVTQDINMRLELNLHLKAEKLVGYRPGRNRHIIATANISLVVHLELS